MKVDIRDGQALLALSPEAMEGYLENSGWWRKAEVANLCSSWTKRSGAEEIEVLVPRQKSASDYRARAADLLRDLEAAEGRSQLDIFEDLITANADVLRIMLHGPSYRTSLLPIDSAIEIVRAAKDLLLAAACSAVKAEPFFSSRRPKTATDFIRKVRLGVSDLSSANLKLFAEVPAARVFPFEEQAPFARGAMLMLESALDCTCGDLRYRSEVDNSSLTENNIRAGVSANLCDALVAMCGDLSDDHVVQIMIAYAPALPRKPRESGSWSFLPSHREFLRALGQRLRESGVDDEYHLVGFVHAMRQLDHEYVMTAHAWIRERVTQVTIHLDEEQGSLAAEAFQQRVPIECYGRLLERKGTFSLDRLHDLTFYPDDPVLDRLTEPAQARQPRHQSSSLGFLDAKKEA